MIDGREVISENQVVNDRAILRKTIEFLKYRGDIVVKTSKSQNKSER
jgi:hypothetical protein